MKSLLLLLFLEAITIVANGQNRKVDSLIRNADKSPQDSAALRNMLQYSNDITFSDPANALLLDQKILSIARQMHYTEIETEALNSAGEDFHFLGNYAEALKMQFEALQNSRQMKDAFGEAETLAFTGVLYNELAEYRQALQYLIPGDVIYQKLPGRFQGCFILANIGDAYDSLGMKDSALYYTRQSYYKFDETDRPHLKSFVLQHMGNIYAQFGKRDSALFFYNLAVSNSRMYNDRINLGTSLKKIADLYATSKRYDSSLYYAGQAFTIARGIPSKLHILKASDLLAVLYTEMQKPDSALLYLRIAASMKDSLYGPEKTHKLQILLLDQQQRQYLATQQEQAFRNRIKYISLLTALGIFLLIAFLLLRTNRHKQKANNLLLQQKEKIEETLAALKITQSQLIQSEKMASLGELTAGIAHEIQNPLNFVNNFSEVNKELLEELKGERLKPEGIRNTAMEDEIINDIETNSEKINHHGKRADAIVKGMLQHSQSHIGIKEPTDINKLADEYLRLAYHGIRAKDKDFNATLKTDFDESIGNINIIPQDIGRVMLNLITNAFYAVQKQKEAAAVALPTFQRLATLYEPTVWVSTKKQGDKVMISVRDNGGGIPQNIVDKIFQPFFTTKPTGQGTGLGLSLAYDIVKAHGGELSVETSEGEGTTFIIQLSIRTLQ